VQTAERQIPFIIQTMVDLESRQYEYYEPQEYVKVVLRRSATSEQRREFKVVNEDAKHKLHYI